MELWGALMGAALAVAYIAGQSKRADEWFGVEKDHLRRIELLEQRIRVSTPLLAREVTSRSEGKLRERIKKLEDSMPDPRRIDKVVARLDETIKGLRAETDGRFRTQWDWIKKLRDRDAKPKAAIWGQRSGTFTKVKNKTGGEVHIGELVHIDTADLGNPTAKLPGTIPGEYQITAFAAENAKNNELMEVRLQ